LEIKIKKGDGRTGLGLWYFSETMGGDVGVNSSETQKTGEGRDSRAGTKDPEKIGVTNKALKTNYKEIQIRKNGVRQISI